MVIVAGYIVVEPGQRDSYLAGCADVVRQARQTPGCLEYAISADLLDSDRMVVFERWETRSALNAFRGSGPSDEQQSAVKFASVSEYDVAGQRLLT